VKYLFRLLNDLVSKDAKLIGGATPPTIAHSWTSTPVFQIMTYWGEVILRPSLISGVTALDRHPDRLLKDLAVYYEDIFSAASSLPPPATALEPEEPAVIDINTPVIPAVLSSPKSAISDAIKPVNKPEKQRATTENAGPEYETVSLSESNAASKKDLKLKIKGLQEHNQSDSTISSVLSPLRSDDSKLPTPFERSTSIYPTKLAVDSENEAVDIVEDEDYDDQDQFMDIHSTKSPSTKQSSKKPSTENLKFGSLGMNEKNPEDQLAEVNFDDDL
jgi:hypothetical protein